MKVTFFFPVVGVQLFIIVIIFLFLSLQMHSKLLLVSNDPTRFVHEFVCDSLTDGVYSKDLFFNFRQWS